MGDKKFRVSWAEIEYLTASVTAKTKEEAERKFWDDDEQIQETMIWNKSEMVEDSFHIEEE